MTSTKFVPHMCLGIYVIIAIRSGFGPYDRSVRLVEILTSLIPVVILVVMYMRGLRFSDTAYIMMTLFPVMHAIGAHYTFALVPSQRLSDLLQTDRNMYDRIAHMTVGFYALGVFEYISIKKLSNSLIFSMLFGIFCIMSIALVYELFERRYAVGVDPEAGIAVLGSQGDIRDAQKDMLMDTLGAVFAAVIYRIMPKIKSQK